MDENTVMVGLDRYTTYCRRRMMDVKKMDY